MIMIIMIFCAGIWASDCTLTIADNTLITKDTHNKSLKYPKYIIKLAKKARSNQPVMCPLCHELLCNDNKVRQHWQQHAGVEIICNACSSTFDNKGSYNSHKKACRKRQADRIVLAAQQLIELSNVQK